MSNTGLNKRMSGTIFNIQRFSLHDGPGIRDLIFMKGCPLRCQWCSNPESQNSYPEVVFNESRCIKCGLCIEACPVDAIITLNDGTVRIDRKLCTNCGECAGICPSKALRLFGEHMSVDEVVKLVEEDSLFYRRSGGGVTVSGGEPASQAEFVHELLNRCRLRGIDTAIETTGYANWEELEKTCRYANLIFYDIKHIDPNKHEALTGVSNELILDNIKRIARYFPSTPIVVRTPIIPEFNDSDQDIEAITEFLSGVESLKGYELLPYHGFGEAKYLQLGRCYSLNRLKPPTEERMIVLRRLAQKAMKLRETP